MYLVWENSVKNNLIGMYFSAMHVFYIFCPDLFPNKSLTIIVFNLKPSMLPIVTKFIALKFVFW